MAAAFALSDSPELRKQYKIRVLQPGWRLGGKGASGRNIEAGMRIEEHGLHVWSGFYENAFWMMRRCYTELGRDASMPLATAFDAFVEHHQAGMGFSQPNGWGIWHGSVPHEQGQPGDAISSHEYKILESAPNPWALMQSLMLWAFRYVQSNQSVKANQHTNGQRSGGWLLQILYSLSSFPSTGWFAKIKHVLKIIIFSWHAWRAWIAMNRLNRSISRDKTMRDDSRIKKHCDQLADRLIPLQADAITIALKSSEDQDLHRVARLAELFSAMMIGLLRGYAPLNGFDAFDKFDLKEWLHMHGASQQSMDEPTIEALYCYVFAYENGDVSQPKFAAGVAVRMAFKLLLCCKGALFWRMKAGMGDTVFAPLYLVLKNRGVEFDFFTSVTDIRSLDGRVTEIDLKISATTIDNLAYDPLIFVKDLPAWPDRPKYELLNQGAQLKAFFQGRKCDLDTDLSHWSDIGSSTLLCGDDFDEVVCAASIAAIAKLAPSLVKQHPHLAAALSAQATVRTQSSQIWLNERSEQLGWIHPPTIVTGLPKPMDTWADLSMTLNMELPQLSTQGPRSVHYFCAVMPDDTGDATLTTQQQADEMVLCNTLRWIQKHSHWVLPNLNLQDENSAVLHDFGVKRSTLFEQQWFSGNIDLTSRYVLSLPQSIDKRIESRMQGVANLCFAGDWVQTGLNYGCVESAVIGGLKAAREISGYPKVIYGENDFGAAV